MKEEVKKTIAEVILELKNTPQVQHSNIPLAYTPTLPILAVRNSYLCMIVPFARYQITGKKDETLVYPIRHTVTLSLPDYTIVAIDDMRFDPRFANVDFSKPVGKFRHEAIKHLDRTAYNQKRQQLLGMYDKLTASLVDGTPFTAEDDEQTALLANMLTEPSLKPFYKVIDADFTNKYLI